MFTPPPSPGPVQALPQRSVLSTSRASDPAPFHLSAPPASRTGSCPKPLVPVVRVTDFDADPNALAERKRATGRRTKWASLLLVPAALLLMAFSTHLLSLRPLAVEPDIVHWDSAPASPVRHYPHKRHPFLDNLSERDSGSGSGQSVSAVSFPGLSSAVQTLSSASVSGSVLATATPSTTTTLSPADTTGAVPTIPSGADEVTLPTPFPQPLDNLAQNFSSLSCQNFFVNMTQSSAFRECRPFSLLLQSSSAFIQAQDNLTLLNDIIWGTCNTDLDSDTCNSNMQWFATSLQTQCSRDLADRNANAVNTLQALLVFPLMRQAGCLTDQSSNSYCYLEAVHNTNPSDLYFYQLPLGIALPNNTTPTCSACTKSSMTLYAAALQSPSGTGTGEVDAVVNSTSTTNGPSKNQTAQFSVTGAAAALSSVYPEAAKVAARACGAGYVTTTLTSAATASGAVLGSTLVVGLVGALALLAL